MNTEDQITLEAGIQIVIIKWPGYTRRMAIDHIADNVKIGAIPAQMVEAPDPSHLTAYTSNPITAKQLEQEYNAGFDLRRSTIDRDALLRTLGQEVAVAHQVKPSLHNAMNTIKSIELGPKDKGGRPPHEGRLILLMYAGEYIARFDTKPRRAELKNYLLDIAGKRGMEISERVVDEIAAYALEHWIYPGDLINQEHM